MRDLGHSRAVILCGMWAEGNGAEELNTALRSLQEKLQHNENIKEEFEKTVQHIKSQAEHTECQIKQQFEKLHQFLRDEEEATITALREEEEQKKQMMKEKLEEMDRHISDLSHTIKDMEDMMRASDVCFLKKFPVSMERVQISQPDPQMASGALIHVSRYLGNLPFRVWKKMQDIVQNTPVILDPKTANPFLVLSDDLTSVRWSENKQPLPDNPERFDWYHCVLGSEGFNSGTHSWDVEVKESEWWSLGVTTASNQRKRRVFFNTDVWCGRYGLIGSGFRVEQDLERVRVYLDYDRGTVSFSDPVTNTPLHTFTTTFTDTLFPFFCCSSSLRILPVKVTPSQAERTERQIKQQFEKLHQFLRDEEEATITALREEEEQKKQMMKEKLEEMDGHISDLSHTIKDMKEMMRASDVCFLKSPDLTAGSTDGFWSFDSCAMILGQPAVQSLEEDAGHRPKQDSAFLMRVGRAFHQHGTVNENVLESDFVALCDGTTRRRSLTDRRLLVGM
ncbi:unnamed protein product [Leuciscus chuanchicus]